MRQSTLILFVIFSVFLVLRGGKLPRGSAQTPVAGIANVTVPFGGRLENPEWSRGLVAESMTAMLADAAGAGVAGIHLQSVAYSLNIDQGNGLSAEGNLFIDVVPVDKTQDFVARLQKRGVSANINYFQQCRPPQ